MVRVHCVRVATHTTISVCVQRAKEALRVLHVLRDRTHSKVVANYVPWAKQARWGLGRMTKVGVFLVTVEHMQEQRASLRVWPAIRDIFLVTNRKVSLNAMHVKLVRIGSA